MTGNSHDGEQLPLRCDIIEVLLVDDKNFGSVIIANKTIVVGGDVSARHLYLSYP